VAREGQRADAVTKAAAAGPARSHRRGWPERHVLADCAHVVGQQHRRELVERTFVNADAAKGR